MLRLHRDYSSLHNKGFYTIIVLKIMKRPTKPWDQFTWLFYFLELQKTDKLSVLSHRQPRNFIRNPKSTTKYLIKFDKLLYVSTIFITEIVYRQCLSDGTWFSCPGLNVSLGVGWTNWSHCLPASTQKMMSDLDQLGCPSVEAELSPAEVS